MSLSYADSLHLESIESRKVTSKENREEEKDEENFDLYSGEMTFQGLNEHIFQRWVEKCKVLNIWKNNLFPIWINNYKFRKNLIGS